MAIGYKKNDSMEMTKLFNTNYHYIVPEFVKAQKFYLKHTIIFDEFNSIIINKQPKVVIIGPISYLLLGKEKLPVPSFYNLKVMIQIAILLKYKIFKLES